MAEFGKWIKIVPGCEMPEGADDVLVLISEFDTFTSKETREVDLGWYNPYGPYIYASCKELGGFDTLNDWVEGGVGVKVIAWMPKPPTELEE